MTKGSKGHSSQGSSGINFQQGTYQGKNANDVYQGYRGAMMNPQTSSEAKGHAHEVMSSFENAAHSAYHGYVGTAQNPQASEQAKSDASSKMGNLPKW